MDAFPDSTQFSQLLDGGRHREAFLLFLEHVQGRGWDELDLDILDKTCSTLLPKLLEHHVSWMINHPDSLHEILRLLQDALARGYKPPSTLDQIAWLRCLLALSEVMAGRPESAHEQLCLAGGGSGTKPPPLDAGISENGRGLDFSEGAVAAGLRRFFDAYVQFLGRSGRNELASYLERRVGRLLGLLARDETRSGVVHALLYAPDGAGHGRFVHAMVEQGSPGQAEQAPGIVYARRGIDQIDVVMEGAAAAARSAADACLKRLGYPDGLAGRTVRWEMATLRGDSVELGGSIALALAIAIISAYLGRPVPNDVSFTGAIDPLNPSKGRLAPVDGIPGKIEYAVARGCRRIYIPSGNSTHVDEHPALRNLAADHGAEIVAAEGLDHVCSELFPGEGTGRAIDIAADTVRNLWAMIRGPGWEAADSLPIHLRHRHHAVVAGIMVAGLVLLESGLVCSIHTEAHYSLGQKMLISALATLAALAGMWMSFCLSAACLHHRKPWAWSASSVLLLACLSASYLLLWSVMPSGLRVSTVYSWPPFLSVMKDFFLFWLFAWLVSTNVFNVIAALEHLVAKRQLVTAGDCLHWNAALESRMPVRCLPFPWEWGAVSMFVVAVLLLHWEFEYFRTLNLDLPPARFALIFGLARDLFFLIAAIQLMVFYKNALADVRHSLR